MKKQGFKKLFLTVLFCFSAFVVFGTHIVGGEFYLNHINNTNYRLGLILYFDVVNGNAQAQDEQATVHIFRKRNNTLVQSITLPLRNATPVNYTNPACGTGDLITRRLEYFSDLNLNTNVYSDIEGYYVVWERCCRNGVIDNIVNPGNAGQTFYMEFPALVRNGQRFINSSPRLFPPLSDYACVNQIFGFDFSGTDADGDSLVYSLNTPINGNSSPAPNFVIPPARPAPYANVNWRSGYNVNNMIKGNPPLTVDRRGILQVKPTETGLFVFAIKVEEYRRGVKIGQVNREFQMLVIACKVSTPPRAELRLPSGAIYNERDTIFYKMSEANRCTNLVIRDNEGGEITTKILPIGTLPVGFLPVTRGNITNPTNPLNLQACFPECPNPNGGAFGMDIIVLDNSCSVPLADTVRIFAKIIPEPNEAPKTTPLLGKYDETKKEYNIEVIIGETVNFTVNGTDADQDSILMFLRGKDFNPSSLGITYSSAKGKPPLTSTFNWKVPCDLLKPTDPDKEYVFVLGSRDFRKCNFDKNDSTVVRITVRNKRIVNTPPTVSSSLKFNSLIKSYVDTIVLGTSREIILKSFDKEKDSILTVLAGAGFSYTQLGITETRRTIKDTVRTVLTWNPPCDLIQAQADTATRTFNFDFKATDTDFCGRKLSSDSTKLRLVVIKRPNKAPTVLPNLTYNASRKMYIDSVTVGDSVRFLVTGNDLDKDLIALKIKSLGFDYKALGMSFNEVTGLPFLTSTFRWKTSCDLLPHPDSTRILDLQFSVNDFVSCNGAKSDSIKVRIVIKPKPNKNQPPKLTTSLKLDGIRKIYFDTIRIGERLRFDIRSDDADRDSLLLAGFGKNFKFKDLGINFTSITGFSPLITAFEFRPTCQTLDSLAFGVFRKNLEMTFYTRDFKDCIVPKTDTIQVRITVVYDLKPNQRPAASATGITATSNKTYFKEIMAGEKITFDVLGNDSDRDSLSIRAFGVGFNLSNVGIKFTPVGGFPTLRAPFEWQPNCSVLNRSDKPKDFEVRFVVQDHRACGFYSYDTITTVIRVKPIPNPNPPRISANLTLAPNQTKVYNTQAVAQEELTFRVLGEDADRDSIEIRAEGLGFTLAQYGMQFPTVLGLAPQTGTFRWTPTCDILKARTDYSVRFIITDRTVCNLNKKDTILVNIKLEDYTADANFKPANVFTPNADGKNDTFTIPNLPINNCQDEFVKIEIYNRWGKVVYSSDKRNFSWDGANYPDGVYYYTIFYKNTSYKGTVTRFGGN